MMPQYGDFMYNIGMLDEEQRDFFNKYADLAVLDIKNKNFRGAFEVRQCELFNYIIYCFLMFGFLCSN